ncbi:aldo/keto reductase [Varibaculum vaginae]|uniref:aldo/keto reductase n=1 Tax=Varibaculum vaginae TaxID=2364797 RepID=UPI000F07BFBF|nr:aldo/keto reductase [Varibaculum vaginae]
MTAPSIPTLELSTGYQIPQFGFGTYKIAPEDCVDAVRYALDLGIRHIDTAQMYHNEAEVGRAIEESGIPRQEIFLTSKLNNDKHLPRDARDSFRQSLEDLRTDYVDLFLIHWPLPTRYDGDFVQTWRTLLEFQYDEKARTVGVSNFQIHHLERLISETGVTPAVNQVEIHPQFANNEVRKFHREHGILTEAWSPLARGRVLGEEKVVAAAKRLGKTPAQVVLRWGIERGDVLFPKSVNPDRIKENLDIFDFQLDERSKVDLDSLDKGEDGRTGSHPDTMDIL